MVKRSTIGMNPLDAVIPAKTAVPEVEEIEAPPVRVTKERLTIHLPVPLIERVKNAVYWTPGLTLAGLAEQALARLIDELEAENGAPFKTRREELKGGRPIK
jgi:hypothetical protein